MKASQLITDLQALIAKHGDLELIYSKDDEGNGFYKIYNHPVECIFFCEDDVLFDNPLHPNAFCVN